MGEQNGKPQPRFRLKFVLAASLGFVACFVIVAYLFGGFDQRINLWRAERHVPILEAALRDHPAFAGIRCGEYTGCGGAIAVIGEVGVIADDAEFAELKRIVQATNPPVSVAYLIARPDTGDFFEKPCADSPH